VTIFHVRPPFLLHARTSLQAHTHYWRELSETKAKFTVICITTSEVRF